MQTKDILIARLQSSANPDAIIAVFHESKNLPFIASLQSQSWNEIIAKAVVCKNQVVRNKFYEQALYFFCDDNRSKTAKIKLDEFIKLLDLSIRTLNQINLSSDTQHPSIESILGGFFEAKSSNPKLEVAMQYLIFNCTKEQCENFFSQIVDISFAKESVQNLFYRIPASIATAKESREREPVYLDKSEIEPFKVFFKVIQDNKLLDGVNITAIESFAALKNEEMALEFLKLAEETESFKNLNHNQFIKLFKAYAKNESYDVANKFLDIVAKQKLLEKYTVKNTSSYFQVLTVLAANSDGQVVEAFFNKILEQVPQVFSEKQDIKDRDYQQLLNNLTKRTGEYVKDERIVKLYFEKIKEAKSLEGRKINYSALYASLAISHSSDYSATNTFLEEIEEIIPKEELTADITWIDSILNSLTNSAQFSRLKFCSFIKHFTNIGVFEQFDKAKWESFINTKLAQSSNFNEAIATIMLTNVKYSPELAEVIGSRWLLPYNEVTNEEMKRPILKFAKMHNMPGLWQADKNFTFGLKVEAIALLSHAPLLYAI